MPAKIILALAVKAHRARQIANLVATVTGEIVKAEKALKLPRSDLDQKMQDIEEHFQEIADAYEMQGIKACGDDLDEWIEVCTSVSDGEKADDEAEAKAIRKRAKARARAE